MNIRCNIVGGDKEVADILGNFLNVTQSPMFGDFLHQLR